MLADQVIFLHQQEIKEFQIYEIQRGSRAEAGQGAVRAAHRLLIHQCLGPSQPTPPGSCSPQKHSHCSGSDSQLCQRDLGGLNHGWVQQEEGAAPLHSGCWAHEQDHSHGNSCSLSGHLPSTLLSIYITVCTGSHSPPPRAGLYGCVRI